ncbi:MAG: hypothetical protein ABIP65_00395 [Vicinamibacterales bacterium]
MKIERLEAALAAATREIERVRSAPQRRWRAACAALFIASVVSIAGSWTLRAQTPARMPGTPDEQILSLLQRVTALEGRSSRVRAPFEVVDDAGKVVLRVEATPPLRGLQLFTAAGQIVATGVALDTGGVFKTWSPDRSGQVSLGVNGKTFAGLLIRASEGGKPRGMLGMAENGRVSLEISNDSGTVVSQLGVNKTGNGILEIGNAAGFAMAQAGVLNGSGAGIFRTFPNGNPAAGLVGMPGTFIMGRSGQD